MTTLHVLQHVPMEGPARIGDVARAMGLQIANHALCDGAPVPKTIPTGDLLVVMGGGMGVGDIGNARWPFLAQEVELITHLLGSDRPVLGVCLGSQLMAHALGARVAPLRVGDPPSYHREVGWGAVTFTVAPETEPSLVGMNESEVMLHWHGDTFDSPPRAKVLASTLACKNQMFRFGERSFGLQFHPEVNESDVATWVRDDGDFVRAANGAAGGDRILEETARYFPRYKEVGDRMIRNILGTMLGDENPSR